MRPGVLQEGVLQRGGARPGVRHGEGSWSLEHAGGGRRGVGECGHGFTRDIIVSVCSFIKMPPHPVGLRTRHGTRVWDLCLYPIIPGLLSAYTPQFWNTGGHEGHRWDHCDGRGRGGHSDWREGHGLGLDVWSDRGGTVVGRVAARREALSWPAWQRGGRLWAGGPGVQGRSPPPLFPERGWLRAGASGQEGEERRGCGRGCRRTGGMDTLAASRGGPAEGEGELVFC